MIKNGFRSEEIGWFPVDFLHAENSSFAAIFPPRFHAFHWHGDTFGLPANAESVGSTEATPNQGFSMGSRALALQFHLELCPADATRIAQACPDDLSSGPYVQRASDFTAETDLFQKAQELLGGILEIHENEE